MIPLAFALLAKKEMYIEMLQAFKRYPKHVCPDFETAASNAFQNKIVKIDCCLFQLGQSVYHQVQQLRLTQEYCTSGQFKRRIKMLTKAHMLGVSAKTCSRIREPTGLYEENEAIQPLLYYFEDNNIGRKSGGSE